MQKTKNKFHSFLFKLGILMGIPIISIIAFIIFFSYHFYPGTTINGMDVSCYTPKEVKERIDVNNAYSLILKDNFGSKTYTASEVGIYCTNENKIDELLKNQNFINKFLNWKYEYHPEYTITNENLDRFIYNFNIADIPGYIETMPVDAYVDYNTAEEKYVIIPENNGNIIDKDKLRKEIIANINNGNVLLSNCYTGATTTGSSQTLVRKVNTLNDKLGVNIVYDFGDNIKEEFTSSNLVEMLSYNKDINDVQIDTDKITEFVNELANKYDTSYQMVDFKCKDGSTTKVSGPYGYELDTDKEIEYLTNAINGKLKEVHEPIWKTTAASHKTPIYGKDYVEVDLTNQKVYLFIDNQLIIETDCVTGNLANKTGTPAGIYPLTYKQSPAVLKGPGYSSPVTYWMPFNGGIGLHDASWRGSFGGNIYKTNGSHGCVNLPSSAAKTIYENVYKGMPVICHN